MVISVTFKGIGAAEAKTLKLNQDKNTKMVPQNVHILYLHPFAFVFITEFTYWSQGFTLKAPCQWWTSTHVSDPASPLRLHVLVQDVSLQPWPSASCSWAASSCQTAIMCHITLYYNSNQLCRSGKEGDLTPSHTCSSSKWAGCCFEVYKHLVYWSPVFQSKC